MGNDSPTPEPSKAQPVKICVFCGSSPGNSPAHMEAARSLAHAMHQHSIHLVYGGGTVGLMGELARTLVSLSGPEAVQGIIPAPLVQYEQKDAAQTTDNNEINTPDEAIYGRTSVTADMHTRKKSMARAVMEGGPGSGFVALGGGYGTLEELLEVSTWNQLGIHDRGVAVYNVEGYYDGLLQWIQDAVKAGFIGEGNRDIIVEAKDAEGVIHALADYRNAQGRLQLQWGSQ
ncbi:MAG: hypothetical protein M1823_003682 [Watsoniomyces obsoletus]|nr:MAG: hypothetical protein M1823_003682 [Watsoniomyces obsoletus]